MINPAPTPIVRSNTTVRAKVATSTAKSDRGPCQSSTKVCHSAIRIATVSRIALNAASGM